MAREDRKWNSVMTRYAQLRNIHRQDFIADLYMTFKHILQSELAMNEIFYSINNYDSII